MNKNHRFDSRISGLSILLTANTTGFLDLYKIFATSSSAAVTPSRPFVKKIMTSASSIAISACWRICSKNGSSPISIPPVSIN